MILFKLQEFPNAESTSQRVNDIQAKPPMQLDKEDLRTITTAIENWESEGLIDAELALKLRRSMEEKHSERAQLAQYFFIIAISSAILAAGALLINEKLLERLRQTFLLSNWTIAFAAAALAVTGFWYARRRRRAINTTTYETYMLPGALSSLVALVYLCKEIGNGEGYTLFTGLCAVLFFALSMTFRSRLLWIVFIASIMGWYGAFSTVFSRDNLFLGMNYPMRFTIFGAAVIGFSFLVKRLRRIAHMHLITYQAGLLIFYTGLWGVSVFGNYNTIAEWQAVRQTAMLPFAIGSGLLTAAGLWIGVRRDDASLRDFSILFLLLNLYTRYFEYFWDRMNQGIFYLILAVSFGLLAKWLSRKKD